MAYKLSFSSDAQKDLKLLSKHAPDAIPKLTKLLEEIVHVKTLAILKKKQA